MKQKLFLITGQTTMALALAGLFINQFYLTTNAILAFVVGIFFGLSLVMNLAYLAQRRKQKLNSHS